MSQPNFEPSILARIGGSSVSGLDHIRCEPPATNANLTALDDPAELPSESVFGYWSQSILVALPAIQTPDPSPAGPRVDAIELLITQELDKAPGGFRRLETP
jgi:hypothetical protein